MVASRKSGLDGGLCKVIGKSSISRISRAFPIILALVGGGGGKSGWSCPLSYLVQGSAWEQPLGSPMGMMPDPGAASK